MSSENTKKHARDFTGKERVNQLGEKVVGASDMRPDLWEARWEKGQTRFHVPKIHPMLEKHYELLLDGKSAAVRCFVPLCGKSLDLKWLAEKGHTVIGNEVVELGCKQFFEEHSIPYQILPIESIPGKIFKSEDKSLDVTLYCCDFFKLSKDVIGGAVDIIWDRGSLAAINFSERKRYSEVITKLMSNQTSYLLDVFRVDNNIFAGPPNDIPDAEIHELFDNTCLVRHVDERNAMTDWQRTTWGVSYFDEHVYLLKRKA